MLISSEQLKKYYREQLIKAGVSDIRAAQASNNLSQEELYIISEIWADWANTLLYVKEIYLKDKNITNK